MVLKQSLNAQKSLDDYINQVKAYLKGVKSVDAEEIVQNINEHIENELTGVAEPVGYEILDEVLKKLGSPQQWVPEEELSWWKKSILRLRTGPEDWRLAYISFGLLLLGFLFHSSFFMFVILVSASFIISRAALTTANDRDGLRGQKWLIYPSLIIVYVPVLLFLLSWPLILIFSFWVPKYSATLAMILTKRELGSISTISFIVATVKSAASLGFLWIAYGLTLLRRKRQYLVYSIFRPFGNRFSRKSNLAFIFIGVILIVLSIVASIIINYFELIPAGLLSEKLFF